ncbi:MAG: phosphatase PAP2 family protein [Bacteroidia bacterium]
MDVIQQIKAIDTDLFIFLNSKHNAFFDVLMYWASHKFFWIPLYLFFLYLVYKQIGKRVWTVLIAVVLLIILSDQLSVHLFKNVFMRLRPCHEPLLQSSIHLLNNHCGGSFGFVSSHAANTFALASFLILFFENKTRYFTFFLIAWACFVSYSRVYSGVHYPGDVIVGGVLGGGIGIVVYKWYVFFMNKCSKDTFSKQN